MKVSVVTFPGSNCDEDALYVCRAVLGVEAELVWHKSPALPAGTDLAILPGGFSYGDALRSGAIARFSPIMNAVKQHAEAGGLVLGICNGFQVLVESGLLPGAMLQNASQKFVCRDVTLRCVTSATPFTQKIERGQRLRMPVAHHEGRYYADDQTLKTMADDDRIVFTYADENPNGSRNDVAGILNERRNVLGMMPHPERAAEGVLGSSDGRTIFDSVVGFLEASR